MTCRSTTPAGGHRSPEPTPDAFLQSGSSPPRTTIHREVLAQRVIAGIGSIAIKLAELEPDIRALWTEFENLPKGQTILGCATKKEFCEKHLHRTPRAIRYMLNGDSNPDYVPADDRREIISPSDPGQTAVHAAITDAINFPDTAHIPQPHVPNPNFNKAGTRGYEGKDAFNSFIRSLVAIAERNPNSPFVSKVDAALAECTSDELAGVAVHELTRAIDRLSAYRTQFAERKSS